VRVCVCVRVCVHLKGNIYERALRNVHCFDGSLGRVLHEGMYRSIFAEVNFLVSCVKQICKNKDLVEMSRIKE